MGQRAPTFGSNPKLMTVGGFLAGRWLERIDDSNARQKAPIDLNLLTTTFLTFFPDHRCELRYDHETAHMTWHEVPEGIELAVVDISGISPVTVESAYQKYLTYHRRSLSKSLHEADYRREMCLDKAKLVTLLNLMPDKKRLYDPHSVRADGTSFMGEITWVRVE